MEVFSSQTRVTFSFLKKNKLNCKSNPCLYRRHVGVKCTGHNSQYYNCEITQGNSCHEVDVSVKTPMKKTDRVAFDEYIKNYYLLSNMHLLASNKLAFPNVGPHARTIHSFVRQRRLEELEVYLREHECLVDSITTLEFLFPDTALPVE